MSTISGPVSDMLMTVKSREVQRGMLAEMRGDRPSAARHFLAAAHLELVLAADFDEIGDADLAVRSRLSVASCFWRAGDPLSARGLSNYPKTLSSPGFYGGYTPFSDSYLARLLPFLYSLASTNQAASMV